MSGLKLCEALLLGNNIAARNEPGERNLGIGALQAAGALPADLSNYRSFLARHYQALAYPQEALENLYPWLRERLLCPWCTQEVQGAREIISHPVREHIATYDEISFEEQLEWLQEMEDKPERRAVAIYLRNPGERLQLLGRAQRDGLTLGAFLAAAVRLILETDLPVQDLARHAAKCP